MLARRCAHLCSSLTFFSFVFFSDDAKTREMFPVWMRASLHFGSAYLGSKVKGESREAKSLLLPDSNLELENREALRRANPREEIN